MSRKKLYWCILSLVLILLNSQAMAGELFADYQWDQQGTVRFITGFNHLEGNEASYQLVFPQKLGWMTDYKVDLAGQLFDQRTYLTYSFLKDPGVALDWTMNFQNPWIRTTYDRSVNIQFPEIRLAFVENQIDGFLFETIQPGISLFTGEEKYIPTRHTIQVNPQENKYNLYKSGIPSDGYIVEDSEVLLLNGERLERNKGYAISYISGDVELFVPITMGANLEAKYLFIPTNDARTDEPGQFQGAVFSNKWNQNIISAYYLERLQEVEVFPGLGARGLGGSGQRQFRSDPPPTDSTEEVTELMVQQVKGVATQITEGPLALNGEVAISSEPGTEPVTAYDIDLQLTEEVLDISYTMQDIPEEFQEVGVNTYVAGKSQNLDIDLRAEEDIHLGVQIKSYQNQQDERLYLTNQRIADVKIFITPEQYGQIIFKDMNQEMEDQLDPIQSGAKNTKDFLVGYTYETKPLVFSVAQSIEDPTRRNLRLKTKYAGFYFDGTYDVEEQWEYKMHKSQVIASYDPVPNFSLNSLLHYEIPFVNTRGNMTLNLSSNWMPSPGWRVRGGYSRFNKVDYRQEYMPQSNDRLSLKTSYLRENNNVELELVKRGGRSNFAKTDGYEAQLNSTWYLGDQYQLSYNLDYDLSYQKMLLYSTSTTESKENMQNVTLSYIWNPSWTISTGYGITRVGTREYNSDYPMDPLSLNTSSAELNLYYVGDEEKSLNLGLNWDFRPQSTVLAVNNSWIYPLGGGLLDNLIKVQMDWKRKDVTKYMFNLDYRFPTFHRLTPEISYKSDFAYSNGSVGGRSVGIGNRRERSEQINCILWYNWQENRGIFLEGRRELFTNWNDLSQNYASLGIYTGVEIAY